MQEKGQYIINGQSTCSLNQHWNCLFSTIHLHIYYLQSNESQDAT